MRRKSLIAVTTILMSILYLSAVNFAAEDTTEEIKITNRTVIISTYDGLRVEPTNLRSGRGTTVIWVNNSRSPVEMLFLDKKVVLACDAPVNFFVGKNGAYESGKIPFGGTASLCFTEKGKYDYIVKSSRTFYLIKEQNEYKGTILIK
jgi:plastocyanin